MIAHHASGWPGIPPALDFQCYMQNQFTMLGRLANGQRVQG